MSIKSRVLLVHEKPEELVTLREALSGPEWELEFVTRGEDALMRLSSNPAGVVVTNSDVVDMTGPELLDRIRREFPDTVRMIMTPEEARGIPKCPPGTIDQFVSRSSNLDSFRRASNRAIELHRFARNEELSYLLAQMRDLPILPDLYREISLSMSSERPSMRKVARRIARDRGIASKIVEIANFKAFGVKMKFKDPIHAATFLGLDLVGGVTLSLELFSKLGGSILDDFPTEDLWNHSFRVAASARLISHVEKLSPRACDHAFTAGLLHDIGKMLLTSNLSDLYWNVYRHASENDFELHRIEREIFRASHAEIGAYVIGLWGLEDDIFHSVLHHHDPEHGEVEFSPRDAVYVANSLDGGGDPDSIPLPLVDYLDERGKLDRLPVWREISLYCSSE